jgi:hypothetical protein
MVVWWTFTKKAINFDRELGFEHGDSHWKDLDEKKTMVPLRRGFQMVEEKRNFDTPSSKKVLMRLGILQYGSLSPGGSVLCPALINSWKWKVDK